MASQLNTAEKIMAQRRKRRSKAEIAAEKAAKEEVVKLKESAPDGFEYSRARNERGHFLADDPTTPENEAWELTEKEEEEVEIDFGSSYEKEIDVIIEEKEVVEETPPPPAKKPEVVVAATGLERIANRFKRNRALKRERHGRN